MASMISNERPEYNPEDEKRAGYASLSDILLLGFSSPGSRPWVKLSGRKQHNLHIAALHETTHTRLNVLTTIGNMQQLLAQTLKAEGLKEKFRQKIKDLFYFSVESTRFVHEGCATYVAQHHANSFEPTIFADVDTSLPDYYRDAAKVFESHLDLIPISKISKAVVAESITRFALSPNVYNLFSNPWDIPFEFTTVLNSIEKRCFKMLSVFSEESIRNSFATAYEDFTGKIYQVKQDNGNVKKKTRLEALSDDRAEIQELYWLFNFFKSKFPELDICPPDEIPQSILISEDWKQKFRNAGVKKHNLGFKLMSKTDLDTYLVVRPPCSGTPFTNLVRLGSPEPLLELLQHASLFTQVYIHKDNIPFVLNKSEDLCIRKDEAYARLSLAFIHTRDAKLVEWLTRCFYIIEKWPGIMQKLVLFNTPSTWLCFWEEELYHCVKSEMMQDVQRFTNPVVGLICANDLNSLKKIIAKWQISIQEIITIELESPKSLFIVVNVPSCNSLLIAPTTKATASALSQQIENLSDWSTRIKWGGEKKNLEKKLVVLLQGIALRSF